MNSTQAWGWLAAGVLALGLNGFYHDGGAAWAHRAVDRVMAHVADRSEGVLAMATGRADWLMSKANLAAARHETASCRLLTSAERLNTKMARMESRLPAMESISAREEAAMARMEANRARIEAQVTPVHITPVREFAALKVPVTCSRVRIRVPRIHIPQSRVRVELPTLSLEASGAGPI